MPIAQYLYVSESAFPMGHPSDQDILRVSRRRNQLLGLTGYLFRNETHFLQILEGPRDAIDMVAGSIRRDLRHHNLREWPIVEVPRRSFEGWDMGYGPCDRDHLDWILNLRHPERDLRAQVTAQLTRIAEAHS